MGMNYAFGNAGCAAGIDDVEIIIGGNIARDRTIGNPAEPGFISLPVTIGKIKTDPAIGSDLIKAGPYRIN